MKKIFIPFVVLSLIIIGGCGIGSQSNSNPQTNTITEEKTVGPTVSLQTDKGKTAIGVEIADTSPERTKGLMFRTSLASDKGMIFIFDKEAPVNFWMKNTLIPMDMIFFDANFNVVKVQKNAQPCKADPCAIFPSEKPAKYVLEVNAGTSDRIGLKDGDKAQFTI